MDADAGADADADAASDTAGAAGTRSESRQIILNGWNTCVGAGRPRVSFNVNVCPNFTDAEFF